MLKYRLIKMLDIAALGVFEPVVRLAYWDEPEVQAKKIFQFIIIPVLAFIAFLLMWNFIAPIHTTKSGEVPTPPVVLDAYDNILTFHEREYQKLADFQMVGKEREATLAEVGAQLTNLQTAISASDEHLALMKKEQETIMADKLAPLQAQLDAAETETKAAAAERKAELSTLAKSLSTDDKEGKMALLEKVKADGKMKSEERNRLIAIKDQMNVVRGFVHPPAREAQRQNSALMAERQYLLKRQELLGDDNKAIKIEAATAKIDETREAFLAAEGTALISKAKQVIRREDSIGRIKESNYAKPWTFPDQIWRSLACVFVGFGIAIVLAIPTGILCGLSPIFMGAMTPLISLFKPVSPIVWLPIVFIIVGGFIDDPEKSAVHPAFLSSAITVALCSLWPTLVNTALGVASIDKDYMNVAKVLKLGFWSRLFKIVIPAALPLMFAGLRISLGVGWMVLIAAELLSSSEGIGKYVWDMFNNGSSETFAQMFVVVFIVGIVGLALDRIMIILQRSVSFSTSPTGL